MTGPTGPAGPENFATCQIFDEPQCNDQTQCYGYPKIEFGTCCYIAGQCQDPLNNPCLPDVEPGGLVKFPPAGGLFPAYHSVELEYPVDGCYCATTALFSNDTTGPLLYPNPNTEVCNVTTAVQGIPGAACWGTLRCDYSNGALGPDVFCKNTTKPQCKVRTYLHSL
jgi:hypothetical protein